MVAPIARVLSFPFHIVVTLYCISLGESLAMHAVKCLAKSEKKFRKMRLMSTRPLSPHSTSTSMFRILTPTVKDIYSDPGPSNRGGAAMDEDMKIDQLLADNDPTQASSFAEANSKRVTGPGEVIADATRWMR